MKVRILLVLSFAGATLAYGQGDFVNLDFESANLPVPGHGFEPVSDALPGWSLVYGTNIPTLISINGYESGGKSGVILYDNTVGALPLSGRYFVEFRRDFRDPIAVLMFQTGLVPGDSQSLRFFVSGQTPWIPGDMEVRLNETPLNLQNLGLISGNYLIATDVSAFAGQTAELRFTSMAYQPGGGSGTFLDNIEFSPLPVPEPSTWLLTVMGAGLAGWCRRSRARDATGARRMTSDGA